MPALGYRTRFMRNSQNKHLDGSRRHRYRDERGKTSSHLHGGPKAGLLGLSVPRRRAYGGMREVCAAPRAEPDDSDESGNDSGVDVGVDHGIELDNNHGVGLSDDLGVDREASVPVTPLLRREALHLASPDDQPTSAELLNGQYFLTLHGRQGKKLLERKTIRRQDSLCPEKHELLEDEDEEMTKETESKVEAICKCRDDYEDWVVNTHIPRRWKRYKRLGRDDDDDNEANDLTELEKASVDREWMMKEYAKVQICNSDTNEEILMKAELLVEEDWLDKVDALPGNLFCLGAFGDMFPKDAPIFSLQRLKAMSKLLGCFLIIIIQACGPPMIFFSKMPGNVGAPDKARYEWRCWPVSFNPLYDPHDKAECPGGRTPSEVRLTSDWDHIMTTKLLSLAFVFAFILNGLFVLLEEKKTWKNVWNTFRFLDWKNENFKLSGKPFLIMGALINCHVIVWTCLDMYVVAGASTSPQDLIMDALGLLFLYNLDDIGGDLGFVDEDDWPGLRIAWIYNELVHPWPDEEFDEDQMDMWGMLCLFFYRFITGVLVVMLFVIPILSCVTPFLQIVPDD